MKNSRQYLFCIVCSLLFIGCASRNSVPEPENYMKVFPADGQLYLQLPVRYNRELALQVVEMLLPDVENADSVLNRIDTAYICVRNRKIYAVATGAFPSVGRNFILSEKNGWKKIRDESLPVTGICYESLVVPYQIAFPSSSTVVLGESVQPLLVSWGNRSVVPEQDEPAAFFSDAAYDGNSIDFCIQNLQELVPLAAMAGLHIPVKDMYGTLTPEDVSADGNVYYALDAQVAVTDARAVRSAAAALKILFRFMGLQVSVETDDTESMLQISGVVDPVNLLLAFVAL